MPTILNTGRFRLYFYSSDCAEPRHVHARIGSATAKFWLDPDVVLAVNHGIRAHELLQIEREIRKRVRELRDEWDDFCSSGN